ncbi:hypothetical protein CCGE531_18375 [Rhizobium sp. CCGE531]|nr:hypothetical protein CCGE531_18375 [Rhizobium sp. CCGE531]AYG74162.1 hypothetical protein CCGE532_17870 [Rhizobium sp. CCGE532]
MQRDTRLDCGKISSLQFQDEKRFEARSAKGRASNIPAPDAWPNMAPTHAAARRTVRHRARMSGLMACFGLTQALCP